MTLLILLVGELAGPCSGELQRALPAAFPQGVPEVSIGETAPPGRSVAWVTLSADGAEAELLLHTARVPGDLRRVLRFSTTDALAQRATAVAFAVANMAHQRDEDLAALNPPAVAQPVTPALEPTAWAFVAAPLVALDVPSGAWGGGLALRFERKLVSWLSVGIALEVALVQPTQAQLLAPAGLLDLIAQVPDRTVTPVFTLGGGVTAWRLSHRAEQVTTWLPVARVGVGARVWLAHAHALQVLGAFALTPTTLQVNVGGNAVGTVGPGTARLEVGYVGAF